MTKLNRFIDHIKDVVGFRDLPRATRARIIFDFKNFVCDGSDDYPYKSIVDHIGTGSDFDSYFSELMNSTTADPDVYEIADLFFAVVRDMSRVECASWWNDTGAKN